MNNKWLLLSIFLCFISCGTKKTKDTSATNPFKLPHAPQEVEALIRENFPGAMTSSEFADSILSHVYIKYGVKPEKVLLGLSTCVDDVIYTKNFRMHPEIKGPFHLGGLAGMPFTGISGLEAFAHHIPDSGVMLLLIEPHIGISGSGGWGHILRNEQHERSACCGALMGTLDKLQSGILNQVIAEDDYQGGKIGELALQHRNEILGAESPIIELTKIVSRESENQIRKYIQEVDMKQTRYIIVITGVLIDTDYAYSDYQYIDHVLVYDVRKRSLVDELRNPLVK